MKTSFVSSLSKLDNFYTGIPNEFREFYIFSESAESGERNGDGSALYGGLAVICMGAPGSELYGRLAVISMGEWQ